MTNTKFRKRALLSSVAMLLVALVALGSATFAWFQETTAVNTTDKMQLKTTAASGLLITTTTKLNGTALADTPSLWGTSADLGVANEAVVPCSLSEDSTTHAATWYTTNGTTDSNGAWKSGNTISEASSSSWAEEYVYFKLETGSTALADVQLDSVALTTTSTSTYPIAAGVRVVVMNSDGTTVLYEGAPTTITNEEWIENDNGTATVHAAGVGGKSIDAVGSGINKTVVSDITQSATASKCVRVRLYLDGGDSHVTTSEASKANLQELIASMRLDFSLTNTSTTNPRA